MINLEIVFSVCFGIFLYKILMSISCGILKGLFPKRWEESKKEYLD